MFKAYHLIKSSFQSLTIHYLLKTLFPYKNSPKGLPSNFNVF